MLSCLVEMDLGVVEVLLEPDFLEALVVGVTLDGHSDVLLEDYDGFE